MSATAPPETSEQTPPPRGPRSGATAVDDRGVVHARADVRGPLRRARPLVLLAIAVAVLGFFLARDPESGQAFDPSSAESTGLRALVLVLRELGADVTGARGVPSPGTETALLVEDELGPGQREELEDWVVDGGTLLVADRASPLVPDVVGAAGIGVVEGEIPAGDCAVEALSDVTAIRGVGGIVYEVADGAPGCFEANDGALVVVEERGEGAIVAFGAPLALTNRWVGTADTALFAAVVLAPTGGERVEILRPPQAGPGGRPGDTSLTDLIPTGVKLALLQLLLGYVVLVAWRSRRLGRPVEEDSAVEIPGSQLTVAVGAMLQRTGSRARAAALLRDETRRWCCQRLGLRADAAVETVAATAAARSELSQDRLLAVLGGVEPRDDAALTALASEMEAVRRAILAGPAPDPTLEGATS